MSLGEHAKGSLGSREALRTILAAALATQSTGRLVQALLDQAAESTDRGWAIQRLETALAAKK